MLNKEEPKERYISMSLPKFVAYKKYNYVVFIDEDNELAYIAKEGVVALGNAENPRREVTNVQTVFIPRTWQHNQRWFESLALESFNRKDLPAMYEIKEG